MPKQRRTKSPRPAAKPKPATHARPKPKPARKATRAQQPVASGRKTARPVSRKTAKPPAVRARTTAAKPPVPSQKTAPVAGSPSRELAVAAFERGFRALQQRQFDRAAQALTSVVTGFPDEKELQERARVYLSICARQAGGPRSKPRSVEERVNAATVAINRGAFDDALRLLRGLEAENAESDHVQYLLCVAFTSTGDVDKALAHLRRAVELNPENKFLSTADTDLEPLRQHAGFVAALEASPPSRRTGARKR